MSIRVSEVLMRRLPGFLITMFMLFVITGFSGASYAAKNKPCSPWPQCQDNGGSGGGGGPGGAPAAIGGITTDSIANAISMHWVVPETPADGDTIHHYEIRYSTLPLDASNFDAATLAERSDVFNAGNPGQDEYFTIRGDAGLTAGTNYNVGIRAVGERGGVSELTFVSVTTGGTPADPKLWEVDNVVDVDPPGENHCCRNTSVQFDDAGAPAIVWGRANPDQIQYAYRNAVNDWVTEVAYAESNCMYCSMGSVMGFSFAPDTGTPAVLFNHDVPKANGRRGNKSEEQVVYLWRRAANDWVAEEVVRGDARENNGIDGYGGDFAMDHFYDATLPAWVPTAAYILTPVYNDPNTIQRLVLSERVEVSGQPAQWNIDPVFECDTSAASLWFVRLRRGADGSLHAMVAMGNGNNTWVNLIHQSIDGTRQYWQSDLFYGEAFAVDSQDRYYVAGRSDYDSSDVAFVESANFRSIDESALCSTPTVAQAGYEIVEQFGIQDTYLNGSEGAVVSALGGEVSSVELTDDDGVNPPDVHLFGLNAIGNYEMAERRVYSRCSGISGWNLDPADRPHDNESWRTVAVSDAGMAWAYTYGIVWGNRYDVLPPDRMIIAERAGNLCVP